MENRDSSRIVKPSVMHVSLLYSISVIILMFLASRVQRISLYPGVLITEFVLILPLPLLYLFLKKYDVKSVLRLNKISLSNGFLVFLMMVFAIPVVNILNTWYLLLIKSIFGRVMVPSVPAATDWKGVLIGVLVIGGSAGICEEIMFRGTIMRGFERFGPIKAIFLTAALFGMWHMYFTSFLGTFLLGALIGFIVYRTDSIFAGMLAHFTNNAISVILGFFVGQTDAEKSFSTIMTMEGLQKIVVFIVWFFELVFFISVLIGLMIAFIRMTAEKVQKPAREVSQGDRKNFIWLLPGLALIGFVYFAFGLLLKGVKIQWVDTVMQIIGLR